MSGSDDSNYLHPEQKARQRIDAMLGAAGWVVQDYRSVNLFAGRGVAARELVTAAGPADYVLFVDGQAVGVIEAKKQASSLAGVEWHTVKCQTNVPDGLPASLVGGYLPFGCEAHQSAGSPRHPCGSTSIHSVKTAIISALCGFHWWSRPGRARSTPSQSRSA